jgi:hypothetical protein
MAARIRWNDDGTRPVTGHVGSLDPSAFSLYQPEYTGDEWVLMSRLPGQENVCRYGASADDLKPEAEKLLAGFVADLGAVFPDAEAGEGMLAPDAVTTYAAMLAAENPDPEPTP